jgi:site-specific DNA-methyltransferase (adenine-specific)
LSALLFNDDCLLTMPTLAPASVDLILCDLPYGTTGISWDSVIPFDALWAEYNRLNRGATVLTAAQPFTSALVMSNPENFKYSWIWRKSIPGGIFNAKNRPLKLHEDIVVFSNLPAANVSGARMLYNPQGLVVCSKEQRNCKRGRDSSIGNSPSRGGSYVQTQTGYPVDVLDYASEGSTLHPTQKPVALMEYLIRTYTNPGDTVLDNCMGSGTTGVACMNTGRNFIGIERDPAYFAIASKRIADANLLWAMAEAERLSA